MRMRKSELSLDEKRKSPTGKKRGGFFVLVKKTMNCPLMSNINVLLKKCPGEKKIFFELSFDEECKCPVEKRCPGIKPKKEKDHMQICESVCCRTGVT